MKQKLLISLLGGFFIALAGTILMLILMSLNLVGPESVKNDNLMYGGTILFISLYIFLLIGLFIGLKRVKKANGNTLLFKEALKVGFYISLSTAIFSVIFTVIFYELICPNYNQDMVEVVTLKLKNTELNPELVKQKIIEQADYYSTSIQAKFSFVGNLITGIVFSLLLGLFLKTKNK
jgi:F0F1-type ATP synthase assembly protein I